MSALALIFRTAAHCLAEAVYPRRCGICGRSLQLPGWLCADCDAKLQQLIDHAACPLCAAPLAMSNAPCPWCLGKGLYPLDRIVRLSNFEDPLRELIHQMKYSHRWPIAELLAESLCRKAAVTDLMRDIDLIVPVPLHLRRRLKRGYNQSDVIAGVVARHFRKPIARAMARVRNTPTQTQLPARKAREENVKNAFALLGEQEIKGKRILLVDDVMTSGATLRETARAMLWAEPASVSAAVLAIADPRHRGWTRV
jgi:ComF family protein